MKTQSFVTRFTGAVGGTPLVELTRVSHESPFRMVAKLEGEDPVGLFSPFGLGILDLVVADLVRRRAAALGVVTEIPDFT